MLSLPPLSTRQPTGQAGAAAPAQHPEGIKDGVVTYKVKQRIQVLSCGDMFREVGALKLRPEGAGFLEFAKAL
jgi:hypothetical protein